MGSWEPSPRETPWSSDPAEAKKGEAAATSATRASVAAVVAAADAPPLLLLALLSEFVRAMVVSFFEPAAFFLTKNVT